MMKKLALILSLVATTAISCDDEIFPELPADQEVLVVDAWLIHQPGEQIIRLTRSQSYFDNSTPVGVSGATVIVSDGSNDFIFTETANSGHYAYTPPNNSSFGTIGNEYTLTILSNGEEYISTTRLNPIPLIDSVTFRYEEENAFFEESYWAEFWSRDLAGEGNTYWIKSYKNGELLNKPAEINIAYDAGFSKGGGIDNLIFIPPIRDGINPFDEDEDGMFISPFSDGDDVYVEIHSISEDAFTFLTNVRIQTDRPGGFAELFAQPLANVPTNISNTNLNSSNIVQGFFNVAAMHGMGATLDVSTVDKTN
ncbi:MAG: DUF4249 domain-containing protein [Cyclobacteriaceae bacterium]